jgi:hypothetical protein
LPDLCIKIDHLVYYNICQYRFLSHDTPKNVYNHYMHPPRLLRIHLLLQQVLLLLPSYSS